MAKKNKKLTAQEFWNLHHEYSDAAQLCTDESERQEFYKKINELARANPEKLLEHIPAKDSKRTAKNINPKQSPK